MDLQFYPSTPELTARCWSKFINRQFACVCDPSAGEGDLLKGHPRISYPSKDRRGRILAIEIDASRRASLSAKGIEVVGHDFLAYQTASHVSHFIMNPPFAQGVAHVLHAWNGLFDGEIVAVLNAQSLRNPCTRERMLLLRLIEQHAGTIDFIQDAFMDPEAARKTPVEIAIVHLQKKANLDDIFGDLVTKLREEREQPGQPGMEFSHTELAIPATWIENAVLTFDAAVVAMRESVLAGARSDHYANRLGQTLAVRNGDAAPVLRVPQNAELIRTAMAQGYNDLKDRAWASVLRSTEVLDKLSAGMQRRMESQFELIKQLEFTVANIYGFLQGLCESGWEIQMGMLCDVFDNISRYHLDNTVFHMGWASNSQHRTLGMRVKAKRFILPVGSADKWTTDLPFGVQKMLSDFDKVFAMLDGKKTPEVSLQNLAERHFKRRAVGESSLYHGDRCSCSYFDIRYYRGVGTMHFYPTRPDLVERLNRLVGQYRKWLPPDDVRAPADFELHVKEAEALNDKVLKAFAAKTGGISRFNLNQLSHGSVENARAVADALVDAVIQVNAECGRDIMGAIANDNPTTGYPLLQAA